MTFSIDENKTEQQVKKLKSKALGCLPSIFLAIIIFSLSALSTAVEFRFSLKTIVWSMFLLSLSLRLALIISSKYAGADLKVRIGQKDNALTELKTTFTNLVKETDISKFKAWVHEQNLKKKKTAYANKIMAKIKKLEHKIEWLEYKCEKKPNKSIHNKVERLKFRLERLKKVSTEEFIAKNIQFLKVKYRPYNANDYLIDSTDSGGSEYKTNVNLALENGKGVAKGLPYSIMVSLFASCLGFGIAFKTVNIVSVLIDLFTILLNFSNGIFIVGQKTLSIQQGVYNNKISTLLEYKNSKGS